MITIVLKTKIPDQVGKLIQQDLVIAESTAVDKFYLENSLNSRIFGNFTILDSGGSITTALSLTSDKEGYIIFQNSSMLIGAGDDTSSKIDIIITDWEQESSNGMDYYIKFNFIGGRYVDDANSSNIYTGSSIEAMESILRHRKAQYHLGADKIRRLTGNLVDKLKTVDAPAHSGGWYSFNQNLFSELDYVVSHSLKFNDYVYWVYDDIESKYMISSYQESSSLADRYILMWTNNTNQNPILSSPESQYKIVMANSYTTRSVHGKKYKSIYPNVVYTIGFGNSVNTSLIEFKKYLNDLTGVSIEFGGGSSVEFAEILGIDTPTYGPREIKQMSNLNTHKLHAFAEDYREFKDATFSKEVDVYLSNNFGLPIGEHVTFLAHDPSLLNQGTAELETTCSGRYIIKKKIIRYDGTGNKLSTQMTLVSDNKSSNSSGLYSLYKTVIDKMRYRS